MNQGIKNIDLIFEDGESIVIEDSLFTHFYIANIDDEANEIPYEKICNTNILYANFIILKINNLIDKFYNDNIIKKILIKKNTSEIKIYTEAGKTVLFNIASSIDPFKKNSINYFDKSFTLEDDLCILICPYNIKYKNHLFI